MVNAVDTQKGGKKRHVSLIPGWNLSQQSSLFAHPVSHSLSLSYPPSGDIKIFHVLDRERRGRGGLVGESMVSRPQCVHVARYITRLQRRAPTRDIRQWFNVWIRELGTVSLESARAKC